ncbi:MAG: HmuY family protein [Oleiphilaceae bacterium]|uniref:HmuY family protein n=1 Tax=Oleiphilus sp. HI0125 TaxID=1822266 RepID=UPI0007C2A0C3|nr:HmuY family protein [Oleiphilus sp. HI0125]KZZ59977.1 hypothetical protein A3762_03785 [Oleiphilus sp. HI0125]MCH2159921.1 HmuY family protein [Oleiphilaceae bacterium]
MTNQKKLLTLAVSSAVLVGCGGSGSSSVVGSDESVTPTTQIDASSYTDYTYFNLETGSEVSLTAAEAAASTAWHIGFRRNGAILNGGTSGIGNVEGALAAAQDDFYSGDDADVNVFLNASDAIEEEHLLASYDTSLLTFVSDSENLAVSGDWYNYQHVGGGNPPNTSANSDNSWLIRSAEGDSYARMKATYFLYDYAHAEVTFEFDVQAQGTSQILDSNESFVVNVMPGQSECYDFDTAAEVACSDASWDVQFELPAPPARGFNVRTNGGISGSGNGGVFGPLTTTDAEAYTSATMAPGSGRDISNHYVTDSNASIFTANEWYAYNLEGNHKLWPNYRTYTIDTDATDADAKVYNLQIINYYDGTGTSGYPTIRFVENTSN